MPARMDMDCNLKTLSKLFQAAHRCLLEKSLQLTSYSSLSFRKFTWSRQEPITWSIQLPCVCATAFLQVRLFLDLSVFPLKIGVSDDVHIKYTNFHKWNVGQALSHLNEFWCPYSLSTCSYFIDQIPFLLKTRFSTIQSVLITCCGISLHE